MQTRHLFLAATLALTLWARPVHAQFREPFAPEREEMEEPDEIETDRDSFTPATTTAGYRRTIVESAWSYLDNRAVPDTNSLPEFIARHGVNDWLELRIGWNFEAGGAPNTISGNASDPEEETGNEIERDSQLSYGAKVGLTTQNGWIPQSAFIVQAGTPTFGVDTATQVFTTYVAGWQFANRWKWDSSIRYGFDSAQGDRFNVWAPSTVLKVPLGEKWAAHAEYFSIASDGRAIDRNAHYFSPGVHYLVTPDLEVGIRVGWGLNEEAANFFSNVGLGWRF
jgi:hypothetical protein